jgi:hypothetical protein
VSIEPWRCRFGSYSLAGPRDLDAVAALLRDSPAQGDMRLFVRPGAEFLSGRALVGRRAVILGRAPEGAPIFLCELRDYPVYLGGRLARATHLGTLRAGGVSRRQFGALEHGFLALRHFARRLEFADTFFTSIPLDDPLLTAVARAGLPRLPRHLMLGDVQSLMTPARHKGATPALPPGYAVLPAALDDARELEGLLAASGSRWSFSPGLTAADIRALLERKNEPLSSFDLLTLRHRGLIVGCAGIWDQRGQRRSLVESYSLGAGMLRLLRCLSGRDAPVWPAPGGDLELIHLPFFTVLHSHAQAGKALLERAMEQAANLGGQVCALSLSIHNPLRRILGLKGESRVIRIYRLIFPGAAGEGERFAPQPEFALM